MSQQDLPLPSEHYARLRTWLIQQLRKGPEPPPIGVTPENWRWVHERVSQLLASARVSLPPEALERLVDEVGDEVVGYGPIGPLMRDPSITEIMVNGPDQIYVERAGKIIEVDVRFRDEHHVMEVIERILKPLGRRVDRVWPMADARLPDGSRVNVIIPPCVLNGPTITIRKFPARRLTVEDLIRFGTMTPEMAEFLRACVIARLNIVVSGGTGSGKTTLLNVLSAFIPEEERIITIEDAAELQLQQRHVVRLEAAPALPDGTGRVTIRDLVINALRMRPDRIIVGECRGPEALDMLQAMNTGHEGSMTTIHANSPRDALSRLETMVLMAGMELPLRVVRTQIASAIDLIVQQERLRDGSRKITRITEIQGMEGDTVVLQDLFVFQAKAIGEEQGKVEGVHRPTGIRPHFMSRLEAVGIRLSPQIFGVGTFPVGRTR